MACQGRKQVALAGCRKLQHQFAQPGIEVGGAVCQFELTGVVRPAPEQLQGNPAPGLQRREIPFRQTEEFKHDLSRRVRGNCPNKVHCVAIIKSTPNLLGRGVCQFTDARFNTCHGGRGEEAGHYLSDPRVRIGAIAGQDRRQREPGLLQDTQRRSGQRRGRDQGIGRDEIVRAVEDLLNGRGIPHHDVRTALLRSQRYTAGGCCGDHAGSLSTQIPAWLWKSAGSKCEASSGSVPSRGSGADSKTARLLLSASPGSDGQEPSTTPRGGSDRRCNASNVSAVWFSVPRPARATTTNPAAGARSVPRDAKVPPSESKATSSPPAPSTRTWSWASASSRIRAACVASGGRSPRQT